MTQMTQSQDELDILVGVDMKDQSCRGSGRDFNGLVKNDINYQKTEDMTNGVRLNNYQTGSTQNFINEQMQNNFSNAPASPSFNEQLSMNGFSIMSK